MQLKKATDEELQYFLVELGVRPADAETYPRDVILQWLHQFELPPLLGGVKSVGRTAHKEARPYCAQRHPEPHRAVPRGIVRLGQQLILRT